MFARRVKNRPGSKGKRISSDIYFYQIRWENGEASAKKMIFIR
jgi:hypothetical protein